MLIRRVVPAIVATLAAYTGLLMAANLLRQHYLTPLLTSNVNIPVPRDLRPVVEQGQQVRVRRLVGRPPRPRPALRLRSSGAPWQAVAGNPRAVLRPARLHAADQLPTGRRFSLFQWIESGWLLALSALLIAVTVWQVRRRAVCRLMTAANCPERTSSMVATTRSPRSRAQGRAITTQTHPSGNRQTRKYSAFSDASCRTGVAPRRRLARPGPGSAMEQSTRALVLDRSAAIEPDSPTAASQCSPEAQIPRPRR